MQKRNRNIAIAILILAIGFLYMGRVFFKATPIPKIPLTSALSGLGEKKAPPESIRAPIKYPNLRLEGTVITREPSAYIRNLDSGLTGCYIAGNKISNATLVDIKRGMVLMDVEGQRYNLYLDPGHSEDKNPFEEASPFFRIAKEGDLLTMVNSDTEGLKASVEMTPQRNKEGAFAGYRLKGIKPASLPFLAGLRNGDIINSLNNQELLTQQKAIQTFRKVRKLKNIQIGLLRKSKNIDLKYNIK